MCHPKSIAHLLMISGPAFGLQPAATLVDCVGIADNSRRLACYDQLAGNRIPEDHATPSQFHAPAQFISAPIVAAEDENQAQGMSSLAQHWELGQENKRGIFIYRSHRANYILATYNSHPNDAPYRPFRSATPDGDGLSHTEITYRIGFKMKLLENALDSRADLWFGYAAKFLAGK